MATYFKYAERDASSQVNWAEVGKGISDMLAETNRIREEKKTAINDATRQFENELLNSPQGQNQDVNNFTNKFAHNMMEQMRIDEQLLKSGQMPLEKYTLRRQNYVDGTNSLFDLSKLYQDEFAKKMEGVNSGKLQAINIFNMSTIEGFADFNNSEATIDSLGDGRIGIALMENKIIDGKTVKVLSKNNMPVNVARGKILQNVETFDVEAATTATVKAFGTRKDVLVQTATTAGVGSITELLGPDFLATKPDPTTQKIVKEMNGAIDDQVNSYFEAPYNLMSVLTQNTGKYGAESFTFDKDEAAKDATKILVKIDPTSNMTTLDEKGPHYIKQKEEAVSWVRANMISKMDQGRDIKILPKEQVREESDAARKAREGIKKAANAASMIGKLWYGNDTEVGSAIDYIKGLRDSKGEIMFQEVDRDKEGVTVTLANGNIERIGFLDANGNVRSQKDFISSAGPLLVGQVDINSALERGSYKKEATFNRESIGRGATIKPYSAPVDAFSLDSNDAVISIRATLPKGFKVEDLTPNLGDKIRVVSPTGAIFESETEEGEDKAGTASLDLQDFVNAELKKIRSQKADTKKGTVKGGNVR